MIEKKISYHAANSYSTLNDFTRRTKNVWIVFHRIGYLSRYFLKHFKNFDPEENYFIAPQAPSKYYLSSKYRHVGASWLTRENTATEIENVLNYLDEVYEVEELDRAPNLILLGYSQGVSVATRWMARRKILPAQLIIHSGKVPAELKSENFDLMKDLKVKLLYGKEDPFLNNKTLEVELKNATDLFGERLEIFPFDGGHEINPPMITKISKLLP